jgi:hypothetical protein
MRRTAGERQGAGNTEPRVQKEQSICNVVTKLLTTYGHAVCVTDHWPDDPLAVGIERRDTRGLLVYIAAYAEEKFHLSFECPPGPEELATEFPYHPAGDLSCNSLDEVIVAVGRHLQIEALA